MNRIMTPLALLATLAVSAPGPAFAALCNFEDIAIFAFNSAHISKDASVMGDVVANTQSPGPVLDEGAEVALDRDCTVTGNVSGHTIDLDRQSTIMGNATYVELVNQGTITGVQTIGAPPYTDVPEFQAASPGGDDVFVGDGETVILGDELTPVTTYGDILISAGGTVVFSGGRPFDVRSIGSAAGGGQCPFPCRSVVFDAPTDLRVEGRIDSEKNTFIGPVEDDPAGGSGIDASDIVIYVGGANGGNGGPLDTPFAVNIGQSSTVEANIYAPNGTIEIDKNSVAEGSFLGLDVEIQASTEVIENSAFRNAVPTANAQEVLTDGANDLVITLEGSDPEGDDLSFSIKVDPAEGTLGAITPITPAPVNQCSQSGAMCSVDSDCPFFAGGETCETVQPPITQATVIYSPNSSNCETDPESGEVTCAEDFFTFGVTDLCSALGTAIVSINGGTDEVPDDPEPGVDVVEANDSELDTVVNAVSVITLSAAAPDTVASLTFRVETLPVGALQDSNGAAVVVAGTDLPSPVLTYQAPGTAGSDSFTFSARDSSTATPPCGPPSCDTGTVNIDVGNLPELAPDQSVGTSLNQPVEITLLANDGGTGGGGAPLAPLRSLVTEVTYGNNGPAPSKNTLSRLAALNVGANSLSAPAPLPLTALVVDQGWQQFSWCDEATAGVGNCFTGTLVDLVNPSPVIEGPFDFSITEASCMRVTDTLAKGDHWRVEAAFGGNPDWTDFTSEVAQSQLGTTSDPDVAFGDLSYSHGAFDLVSAGSYSVQLTTIPPDSFVWGTAGYIRVDTGPCVDIVWTVTTLPDPLKGTLTNLDGSAVQTGDTYFALPTLVFTPAYNFSGATSFEYEVAQGGTLGIPVVDTAIVDILVSADDPCVLVGREPGCNTNLTLLQGLEDSASSSSGIEGDTSSASSTIVVESTGGASSPAGGGSATSPSPTNNAESVDTAPDLVRDRQVHGVINQPVTFDLGL